MRLVTRALAVTAAALPLAALMVTPASASPEDGKGCAGLPAIPQSYVCVISATPENAVPTTTTTNVPVPVPRVCYVADCFGPTTVNVPVPGVQPGTNAVAVIWYQGVYYPIAVGQVPSLALVQPYVTLLTGTVNGAVTTATALANNTVAIVVDAAGDAYVAVLNAYGTAYNTANTAANDAIATALETYGDASRTIDETVAGVEEDVDRVLTALGKTVYRYLGPILDELGDGQIGICEVVEIVARLTGDQWACYA